MGLQPFRINPIHRILQDIPIKIRIAAVKENGILGRPSSRFGVIVACAKARQLRVRVMQAASKAKRLKARPAVFGDLAPGVIVQLLRNFSQVLLLSFHLSFLVLSKLKFVSDVQTGKK